MKNKSKPSKLKAVFNDLDINDLDILENESINNFYANYILAVNNTNPGEEVYCRVISLWSKLKTNVIDLERALDELNAIDAIVLDDTTLNIFIKIKQIKELISTALKDEDQITAYYYNYANFIYETIVPYTISDPEYDEEREHFACLLFFNNDVTDEKRLELAKTGVTLLVQCRDYYDTTANINISEEDKEEINHFYKINAWLHEAIADIQDDLSEENQDKHLIAEANLNYGKAIQFLEKIGVTVSDELRKKKDDLQSKLQYLGTDGKSEFHEDDYDNTSDMSPDYSFDNSPCTIILDDEEERNFNLTLNQDEELPPPSKRLKVDPAPTFDTTDYSPDSGTQREDLFEEIELQVNTPLPSPLPTIPTTEERANAQREVTTTSTTTATTSTTTTLVGLANNFINTLHPDSPIRENWELLKRNLFKTSAEQASNQSKNSNFNLADAVLDWENGEHAKSLFHKTQRHFSLNTSSSTRTQLNELHSTTSKPSEDSSKRPE